jgi:hypothetical protein
MQLFLKTPKDEIRGHASNPLLASIEIRQLSLGVFPYLKSVIILI